MKKSEIKKAIKAGAKMFWNDPDPIEGNDYTIHNIFDLRDETCLIHYGSGTDGMYSEAEVYNSEISLLN